MRGHGLSIMSVGVGVLQLVALAADAQEAADVSMPAVEWEYTASAVPGRLREIAAYLERVGGLEDGRQAVQRMKMVVASKKTAPTWIRKDAWTEKVGDETYWFGVGVMSGSANMPMMWDMSEARARERVAWTWGGDGSRRADSRDPVSESGTVVVGGSSAIDWYFDGKNLFTLVVIEKVHAPQTGPD